MKNILITGASGNLGRTIVAAFEQADEYHINIISREEVQGSSHLKAFHIDLLDQVSTASLVEEIIKTQQHIDAVIFLTGGYIEGDITQNSSTHIQKMIGLNIATAHNIASPLIDINRLEKRPLKLIFIGAKSAMDTSTASKSIAYALSKKALYHYVSLINESEKESRTSAFILLPGTLDIAANRNAFPEADVSAWTNTDDIAYCIRRIIEGELSESVIKI